jgi:thymidylate synthase ThyX
VATQSNSMPNGSAVVSAVKATGPMPPEAAAYALARYSRSPDSIEESIRWVQSHDSSKFLESFYFQYGHGSIADLGHLILSFEGVSELAAVEIVDEQVWDGQQKSTRYQDFSKTGYVVPSFQGDVRRQRQYREMASQLLETYGIVNAEMVSFFRRKLPKPASMKEDKYESAIKARAFDVARYLLFLGIPTNVGQVTSIRTLERQIRRLAASHIPELRQVAEQMRQACQSPPAVCYNGDRSDHPVAPTLAKYTDAATMPGIEEMLVLEWMHEHNVLPGVSPQTAPSVHLLDYPYPLTDSVTGIVHGLLYRHTAASGQELLEILRHVRGMVKEELVESVMKNRRSKEHLPRAFRQAPYVFDIVTDIGAYRDLHRHRRSIQIRQEFTNQIGYVLPAVAVEAGVDRLMAVVIELAFAVYDLLRPDHSAQYILPFATLCRSMHRMDFDQLSYVIPLRSGVKGHDSYRWVAHEMWLELQKQDPFLASQVKVTHPSEQDLLTR